MLPVRLIHMTVKTLGEHTVGNDAGEVENHRVDNFVIPGSGAEIESAALARSHTVHALKQVFEALDGRRPAEHLLQWIGTDVYAQLSVLLRRRTAPMASNDVESTRLLRVHMQAGGPRQVEFFGTFTRGARVRAIAGRAEIQRVVLAVRGRPRRPVERWVIVELSIV